MRGVDLNDFDENYSESDT